MPAAAWWRAAGRGEEGASLSALVYLVVVVLPCTVGLCMVRVVVGGMASIEMRDELLFRQSDRC